MRDIDGGNERGWELMGVMGVLGRLGVLGGMGISEGIGGISEGIGRQRVTRLVSEPALRMKIPLELSFRRWMPAGTVSW